MNILNYLEFRNHVEECLHETMLRFSLHYNEELVDEQTKNCYAFLENKLYRIELNTINCFPQQWIDIKYYALENPVREISSESILKALNITLDEIMKSIGKLDSIDGENGYQESMRYLNIQLLKFYSNFFDGKLQV
ncbi:MAG: hypothetical protein ACK5Z2_12490 [Bacteroidota bacterium]|jgi:hypothetical protein